MKTKFTFATILIAIIAVSLTSCSTNDEELQTNNFKAEPIEISEQMMQKEGDTVIPNENEPIIVKPRK